MHKTISWIAAWLFLIQFQGCCAVKALNDINETLEKIQVQMEKQ